MSETYTGFRVFIASPGGLGEEREAFKTTILEYNDADAMPRRMLFRPIGWEDTLGGVGRPQRLINEDIQKCDYFVMVLWDRWGSSPNKEKDPDYTSGTEEEFHVASEALADKDRPMRQLLLLFKAVDPKQLSDPGPQLEKVLDFRLKIEREKTHLYLTFDSKYRFEAILRKHLAAWLRAEEGGSKGGEAGPPSPGPGDTEETIEEGEPTEDQEPLDRPDDPLTAKAWSLADEGRLTEAEVEFAKAVAGRNNPESLMSYGRFLGRVGRLAQATVLLEAAIQMARQQGSETVLSSAYTQLGGSLQARGNLDAAEEMYRKAVEIDQRLGNQKGLAGTFNNLGTVLSIRGDLDAAEEMHRKALEINQKLGDRKGLAMIYSNLGTVFSDRGDLDAAEEMHRKALVINLQLGRKEGLAKNYGNLGVVLFYGGDLDAAEAMHRKALEIEQKLGRKEGLAADYANLGNVFFRRKDLAAAEEMYRRSLEINQELGNQEGMAIVYGSIGSVLRVRGDLDAAEVMYRKSLEIGQQLRPRGKFQIFTGIDKQFYFRLRAANGEIILASEGFTTKASCMNAIDSVKTHAPNDANYKRETAANGEFYYLLVAKDRDTIGTSQTYTSEQARERGIAAVKGDALGAPSEDLA